MSNSHQIEHNIPWFYNDPSSFYQEVTVQQQYDGVIFVERTTPTRPTANALETVAKREGL